MDGWRNNLAAYCKGGICASAMALCAALLNGCTAIGGIGSAPQPQAREDNKTAATVAETQPASEDQIDPAVADYMSKIEAAIAARDQEPAGSEEVQPVEPRPGPPRQPTDRAAAANRTADSSEQTAQQSPAGQHAQREAATEDRVSPPTAAPGPVDRSTESETALQQDRTESPIEIVDLSVHPTPHLTGGASGARTQLNAAAGAAVRGESIQDFVQRVRDNITDDSFRAQFDGRIAAVLAGDLTAARKPYPIASRHQQELSEAVISLLIAARATHDGDGGEGQVAVKQALRTVEQTLAGSGDLTLSQVLICRSVRGFGQYDLIEPPQFPAAAAAEFVAYGELSGFAVRELEGGGFEARFDLTTRVYSHEGKVVAEWSDTDLIDRCRSRRRDCFIPRLIQLPTTLAAGEYVLKMTVADRVGNKVAESRTTFAISADLARK